MHRSLVVAGGTVAALAVWLLTPACGRPCEHLLDCPTGEICSPDAICVPAPPPTPIEPVTCVPGADSQVLMMDTGYTVGATRWDCPALRAMVEGTPTVSLSGFGTAVNGGSLTLTATVTGAGAAGRWVYFGIDGDGMFAKQVAPAEAQGFPIELFLDPGAVGGAQYFYMGIDDGAGSPEQPRPVNVARLRIGIIQVQSGDIQVSVTWDNDNDVDLHLTTPDGEHIYFGNASPRGETFGQLDLDSNVGCVSGDPRNENIFFPVGSAIDGEYVVSLDLYSGCTPLTRYRATIVKNGGVVDVVDGTLTADDPASHNREIARITWP